MPSIEDYKQRTGDKN